MTHQRPALRPARRRGVAVLAVAAMAASTLVGTALGAHASSSASYVGPDVSNYQHPGGASISWTKVAAAGQAFAIVKATEGTTYTNPYFATDYAGSLAAGLVHGSYHFARPALPISSTAMAQAQYFAATVGDVQTASTLPPALDLEVTGGLSPSQLVAWAQTFMYDMKVITGRAPMIYTYPDFYTGSLDDAAAFERFPLWMAHYGTSVSPVSSLWQYTSSGSIKGISGEVDQSRYVGATGPSWSDLSDGTVADHWPSDVPGAPTLVRATGSAGGATVSWMPPDAGSSMISTYTVTAEPGGAKTSVSGTTTGVTITGLSGSTPHTFRVSAANAQGRGPRSVASGAVVSQTVPVLTLTAPSSLTSGSPATVTGKLTNGAKTPLSHQTVRIQYRTHKSSTWTKGPVLRTTTHGHYTTNLAPTVSTDVRAVYGGGAGVRGATSPTETIYLRPAVTATPAPTAPVTGQSVTLSGKVSPGHAGDTVTQQALRNGSWTSKATATLSSAKSFTFHVTVSHAKSYSYRIMVPAKHHLASATSHVITVSAH